MRSRGIAEVAKSKEEFKEAHFNKYSRMHRQRARGVVDARRFPLPRMCGTLAASLPRCRRWDKFVANPQNL